FPEFKSAAYPHSLRRATHLSALDRALRSDAEGPAHERVDPAEVGVGAGSQPPWRPPAEPMNRGQAVPQLPGVELEPAIRDRIGDARGSVARRTARGDRVVDALRVVAAD